MTDTANKLFIGNLAYSANASELKNLFSAYGTVLEVSIPSDRTTGRPRGFAFVTMETEDEAKAALVTDGTEIQGRKIAVNIANNKRNENTKFSPHRGGRSEGRGDFGGNKNDHFGGGYQDDKKRRSGNW